MFTAKVSILRLWYSCKYTFKVNEEAKNLLECYFPVIGDMLEPVCTYSSILRRNSKIAGAEFENRTEVIFEEYEQKVEKGKEIVLPEFYDSEMKRVLRPYDEVSVSTLVLRSSNANKTYYIDLIVNEDLGEVPLTFNSSLKYVPETRRCHFHGEIISKPTGLAAISACSEDGKVTGVLMMEENILFLSPSFEHNEHYLYEYDDESTDLFHFTAAAKNIVSEQEKIGTNPFAELFGGNRVKRATGSPRKVIEVAIFVDQEFHNRVTATAGTDARQATGRRVYDIMNQVQMLYSYSTMKTKFKIFVVKVMILSSSESAALSANGDGNKYLDNFCGWQARMNTRDGTEGHWDHAILLTGRDIYGVHGGRRQSNLLGLALLGGMCQPHSSCSLSEGSNFQLAFVVAHELAHNLGASHDGTDNNCNHERSIMAAGVGAGKIHWSKCSNDDIQYFLRRGNGRCLSDDAYLPQKGFDLMTFQTLPGQRHPLTSQCILALGSGYMPYKSWEAPYNNPCNVLWCKSGYGLQSTHPALEGSSCDVGKICLEGVCRSSDPGPINPPRSSPRNDPNSVAYIERLRMLLNAFRTIRYRG